MFCMRFDDFTEFLFLFFCGADDHAVGLSTFTIMAGLGGSMGYVIGAIDWGWLGNAILLSSRT